MTNPTHSEGLVRVWRCGDCGAIEQRWDQEAGPGEQIVCESMRVGNTPGSCGGLMDQVTALPLDAVKGLVAAAQKVSAHRTVLNEAFDTVLVDAEDQTALINALDTLYATYPELRES